MTEYIYKYIYLLLEHNNRALWYRQESRHVHSVWFPFAFLYETIPSLIQKLFPSYSDLPTLSPIQWLFQTPRDPSPRIWPIHGSNLPTEFRPLHFPPDILTSSTLKLLVPFHQLVDKSQVGLDDHVEAASAHEAVCAWKRQLE